MEYVYLGKITNTHGIKGEIKILSNFEKKNLVFKPGFNLYIGNEKKLEQIKSYRPHQNYDMVVLEGINDINEVLKYKGLKVYINKEDLKLENQEYLLEDLIGCKIIYKDEDYGIVEDVYNNKDKVLLYVKKEDQYYYIPLVEDFIKEVEIKNKKIRGERIDELR